MTTKCKRCLGDVTALEFESVHEAMLVLGADVVLEHVNRARRMAALLEHHQLHGERDE